MRSRAANMTAAARRRGSRGRSPLASLNSIATKAPIYSRSGSMPDRGTTQSSPKRCRNVGEYWCRAGCPRCWRSHFPPACTVPRRSGTSSSSCRKIVPSINISENTRGPTGFDPAPVCRLTRRGRGLAASSRFMTCTTSTAAGRTWRWTPWTIWRTGWRRGNERVRAAADGGGRAAAAATAAMLGLAGGRQAARRHGLPYPRPNCRTTGPMPSISCCRDHMFEGERSWVGAGASRHGQRVDGDLHHTAFRLRAAGTSVTAPKPGRRSPTPGKACSSSSICTV